MYSNFQNCARCVKDLKDYKHDSLHLGQEYARICVLGHYLFLKAHTVRFSEQIMSADKYPSIFLHQMETIVYISRHWPAGLKIIFERWPVMLTGQTNLSSVMSHFWPVKILKILILSTCIRIFSKTEIFSEKTGIWKICILFCNYMLVRYFMIQIYVNHWPGGPYWAKRCPRSRHGKFWLPILLLRIRMKIKCLGPQWRFFC